MKMQTCKQEWDSLIECTVVDTDKPINESECGEWVETSEVVKLIAEKDKRISDLEEENQNLHQAHIDWCARGLRGDRYVPTDLLDALIHSTFTDDQYDNAKRILEARKDIDKPDRIG